jgi:LAO/AO transport system kinase
MEIANIFVLNKCDRQGADGIAATIKNIIHLKPPAEDKWTVDVIKTTGSQNKGMDILRDEIFRHQTHLQNSGFLEKKRKENLRNKILELVNNKLQIEFWDDEKRIILNENLDNIYKRENDPYSFVKNLVKS